MATQIWFGVATAAAQISTVTIGTYDATTTYKVTIGGQTISTVGTGGTNATTATALKNLLIASTHPYFATVTWTVSSNVITGTANTAGVPFVFSTSVSGGTGTISNATTTASSGPNDWSTAANWSTGSVPVASDDVYVKSNSVNICWGLAQSGVTLNSLTISKSYTGKIGLDTTNFATSSDGATVSTTTEPEYRQAYLQISSTNPISIGEQASIIGTATGSSRIMLDVGSVASQVVQVLGTASSASETGKPAVRLLANAATIDVYVRSAPGGCGVAIDKPGETATIRNLYISDTSAASNVVTGNGVTMTLWEQVGGKNVIQSAATLGTLNVKGGTVQTEGSFAVTTANVYTGGTLTSNSTGTISALNPYGGTISFTN